MWSDQKLPMSFCSLKLWLFLFWPKITRMSSVCSNLSAYSISSMLTFSSSPFCFTNSLRKASKLVEREYFD